MVKTSKINHGQWREGGHEGVCRRRLCVIGGFESSQCAVIYVWLSPVLSSGCSCLQGRGGAASSPTKRQMSSSQNASIKIHIPYGGIQKKKKMDRNCTLKRKSKLWEGGEGKKKKVQRGMKDGLIWRGGREEIRFKKRQRCLTLQCSRIFYWLCFQGPLRLDTWDRTVGVYVGWRWANTHWLMAWLLRHSHCGILPHIGSCQWCRGWAWSLFQAAPRSLSGWSDRRRWSGWWLDPSVRSGLDIKEVKFFVIICDLTLNSGAQVKAAESGGLIGSYRIDRCDAGTSLPAWGSQNWWQHSQLECQFLLWRGLKDT